MAKYTLTPIDRSIAQAEKAGAKTKADIARFLLQQENWGYTVQEISNAVPMAYSQVHSIKKKLDETTVVMSAHGPTSKAENDRWKKASHEAWGPAAKTPTRRSTKPVKSPIVEAIKKGKPVQMPKPRKGIGKLRVPGMPSDTDVGPCVNCGHDLVVRPTSTGFVLTHINIAAEELLNTVQFCQAVPQVLLA